MRPTSFDPSALRQHLRRNKIADLPELKRVLGTDTDLTVFRKLKQLQYLASYTHRGRFYTLPEIARFDDRGLWSHEGVWFSRHGTLLATLETFVNQSPNGYYAYELADALHAEVQQPLRHLVEQQRLARMEVGGQFLYTDIESAPRRKQLLARRSAQAVPVAVHSADLQASPDELKAAILLFYGLLVKRFERNSRIKFPPTRPARPTATLLKTRLTPRFAGDSTDWIVLLSTCRQAQKSSWAQYAHYRCV